MKRLGAVLSDMAGAGNGPVPALLYVSRFRPPHTSLVDAVSQGPPPLPFIDDALGTDYVGVGTRCIVTIQVDHSSESNPKTQVGTTKKRVVPGRRRKRVAGHRALSLQYQGCMGTLGRTPAVPAILHCKCTVEPERFNPQRLIAGIYVWLFLMPTDTELLRNQQLLDTTPTQGY
jgi:hypothetical protein